MTPDALAAKLFDTWNTALQTGDPRVVADCYAADAVLVPTLSSRVRADRDGIIDYFVHFLYRHPIGRITENHVHREGHLLVNSGLYTFCCRPDGDATARDVEARFTFVYRQSGDQWEIIAHHSSQVPES